jgi:hypothetical protein
MYFAFLKPSIWFQIVVGVNIRVENGGFLASEWARQEGPAPYVVRQEYYIVRSTR